MEIIFTKNNTVLSRLIRYLTKEPVSHCAIRDTDYIIHSNLLGINISRLEDFHSEVLYSVEIPYDPEKLATSVEKYEGRMYDFGALLYLGLRCIFKGLPKQNLWQCSGMFLCTEWVTQVLDGKEVSDITPYQLYLELKEKYK